MSTALDQLKAVNKAAKQERKAEKLQAKAIGETGEGQPTSKEDKFKQLEAVAKTLNAQFKTTNSIQRMGDRVGEPVPHTPTNIVSLDKKVFGCGGIPKGRIIEVYGPECLSGESFIKYEVRSKNGVRINTKGGTLKRLFERFNNVCEDGRANKLDHSGIEFYAPSVNDEGRVIQNKITGVIYSGVKECYTLYTKLGYQITATMDHKFKTPDGWKSFGDLKIGDKVLIHNSTPFTVDEYGKTNRSYLSVKTHGVAYQKSQLDKKTGNIYQYHILRKSRAVVEALINGLSFEEYIDRLNKGTTQGFYFLPSDLHVHHRDENDTNDSLSNLLVIGASEHGILHANERHNNLRYVTIEDEITDFNGVGTIETYDISMAFPYNNFVADNFVVHNSAGKTTITLELIAAEQRAGNLAAFVDAEHALDPNYASLLGVDMDELLISQPDSGEQALETVIALIESKTVSIIAVDSVAALTPQAELDGEMGDANMGLQARLISQAMRKIRGIANLNGVEVIFINQLRDKLGVMFGNPETTTGGKALRFYSSVRLDVRRVSKTDGGEIKIGETHIGHRMRVKAVKNKVGTPFRETVLDLIYGKGIDKEGDLIRYAVELGIVEQTGAWFKFEGEQIGQGLINTVDFIRGDVLLYQKIKDKVDNV